MDEKKKKEFPQKKVVALRPEPNESQYLTQLKTGDVAEYVLMTVLWDYSSEEVAKSFDKARKVADTTEYITYTGEYHGAPVSVVSTGSGSPTLVDAMDELVDVGAKTIIRIGCSGAIQEDIQVGDLVITSGGVRSEGASKDYIPLEYPAVANYEVVMALVQAAEENGFNYHVGITRSHASFYVGEGRPGPKGFWYPHHKEVVEYWRKANVLNFEMEAAALCTLANLFGCRGGAINLALANRITNELNFQSEGWTKVVKTSLDAIAILYKWDETKKKRGKKWLYPGLLTL